MSNREIKFRAKRIDRDDEVRWVYGHYFTAPLTDENSGLPSETGWFFLSGGERMHCIEQNGVSFVIHIDTLGQYIGLKDKNGKEIYEDDIVNVNDERYSGQVKWNYQDLSFVIENREGGFGFVNGQIYDEMPEYRTYEVIGNVHDNLELHSIKGGR